MPTTAPTLADFQPGDEVRHMGTGPILRVRTVHPETDETVGGIDLGYGGSVVVFMADPADLVPFEDAWTW